ncbi:hypothetical protein LCGC14_2932920 [marine sediment metagenome]|uniref:Glycosyltransferase 2-like domain-containing protein n=1 Tax=marine sediment metagenome TaxID=412755 RepID=A0A0F8XKU9_9ZZZZ
MKCSICIATFNKASWLAKTLDSIVRQNIPFDWEVIVVDDGSTDNTVDVCQQFGKISYIRIDREPVFRNPSMARNVAYRAAKGDVLICQSDEVLHVANNTIEHLTMELEPNTFSVATVWNTDKDGNHKPLEQWPKIVQLTGPKLRRPFFFLGSLLRSDMYKAGGNDELYESPGSDDNAFADSLMRGLKLQPNFVDIVGHHVEHPRPKDLHKQCGPSIVRYRNRHARCILKQESWLSPTAPWPYVPQQSLEKING